MLIYTCTILNAHTCIFSLIFIYDFSIISHLSPRASSSHGVSPNRTEKSRTLRSAEKDAAFGSIAESVQKRLPSKPVPRLTETRFSHGHLAQLKYILPEAICIKKILTHDEPTSCIKPDLQVVLQIDAFEDGNEQKKRSGYHKLSQVFRSRLVEFSKEHPDGRMFLKLNYRNHSITREESFSRRRLRTRFHVNKTSDTEALRRRLAEAE
ncbi:unnamed protein product [Spirodela intermedia]|uniref:Uncharacterized protein n=1 Tax=Spirodela intermedia TaxID=51605 RepID=A0A7I8JT05_SPIIN|nr:unnamed protein product [Spirodela intermedia]CAA6673337.1 unnamed protein product [Spirodela intermedia]